MPNDEVKAAIRSAIIQMRGYNEPPGSRTESSCVYLKLGHSDMFDEIRVIEVIDYLGVSCWYWQVQERGGLPGFRRVRKFIDVDTGDKSRDNSYRLAMKIAQDWAQGRPINVQPCSYRGIPRNVGAPAETDHGFEVHYPGRK